MYNRSCYNTLTYNNTVKSRPIGATFTEPIVREIEYVKRVYEFNVTGTSRWSFVNILNVIGNVKNKLTSSLNLRGSSKYQVKDELNIYGVNKFQLGSLLSVNGNKKFENNKIFKSVYGISKFEFGIVKNINGLVNIDGVLYKDSASILKYIKGSKKFNCKLNKGIVGKRDIISTLASLDIL